MQMAKKNWPERPKSLSERGYRKYMARQKKVTVNGTEFTTAIMTRNTSEADTSSCSSKRESATSTDTKTKHAFGSMSSPAKRCDSLTGADWRTSGEPEWKPRGVQSRLSDYDGSLYPPLYGQGNGGSPPLNFSQTPINFGEDSQKFIGWTDPWMDNTSFPY